MTDRHPHEWSGWHRHGDPIPGSDGVPAFSMMRQSPSAIPVIIAVPHAGRAYPGDITRRLRDPVRAGLRLEDRYADLLAQSVAERTGAGLIAAHAPRAMIDLNRAPDDVDWDMIVGGRPANAGADRMSRRARGGLGLVPRRVPGLGELWNSRLDADDLAARIDRVHVPYHAALARELADLRARWGGAILIDLHSMPPLAPSRGGPGAAEFVIGDRFGSACAGFIAASVFDHLGAVGGLAAHNRPYAGGYVLDRHASPGRGIHALQVEVCRSAYLDADMAEPGEGFERVTEILAGLVRRVADELGASAQGWSWAAE